MTYSITPPRKLKPGNLAELAAMSELGSLVPESRLTGKVFPGASGLVIGEGSIEVPTSIDDFEDPYADIDGNEGENEEQLFQELEDKLARGGVDAEVAGIFAEDQELNEFTAARLTRSALMRAAAEVDYQGQSSDPWIDMASGYDSSH